MAGADRKRQKKLEQSRKKRELLKKQARQREARFQGAGLLRTAQGAPFGPAWVSASLDEPESEDLPALVTVVVTRRVRGQLLAEMMVVDRTCLGIKNAMLTQLMAEPELLDWVEEMSSGVDPLRECEPLEAQSVVFHALDFARSLGFGPHEDFEIALLQPRPETLLATPLSNPPAPIYASGPDDDVEAILARLEERVGSGNYQFVSGLGELSDLLGMIDDDEDDDDEDDDQPAAVIETTGESSDV